MHTQTSDMTWQCSTIQETDLADDIGMQRNVSQATRWREQELLDADKAFAGN